MASISNFSSSTQNEAHHSNLPIGQLAFLKGYMSEENVHHILDAQKSTPRPFGELCIAKGMMTPAQTYELLQLQLKNQCILLNSLIPAATKRSEMNKQITRFKDNLLCNEKYIVDTKLHDVLFLNTIFNQTRTFLFHQGYYTQTKSISSEYQNLENQVNFACELKPDVGSNYYFCLGLNKRIYSSIANSRQESYSNHIDTEEFQDIFLEIMNCLNYRITQILRKLGHNVKQGAALAHIPEYRQCVSIKFNTILYPIEIAVLM